MELNHLDEAAGVLVRWAQADDCVRALFWFGAYARAEAGETSDLDVALLLREDADSDAALDSIGAAFEGCLRYMAGARGSSRRVYWLGEEMVKIDVSAACSPEGLAWLADAHDVPPPRLQLACDRDDAGADLAARGAKPASADARSRADAEVEKFLVGLDACSRAHRDGDAYRFYFEYNLALGRLARLIQISRGGPEHLYLPRRVLANLLDGEERREFAALAGTMELGSAGPLSRRLAGNFLHVVDELKHKGCTSRTPEEVTGFVDAILQNRVGERERPGHADR